MSKIKKFRELVIEGKTREEARDISGVADATSKIQIYKIKKEGLLNNKPEPKVEDSEDVTIEETND